MPEPVSSDPLDSSTKTFSLPTSGESYALSTDEYLECCLSG